MPNYSGYPALSTLTGAWRLLAAPPTADASDAVEQITCAQIAALAGGGGTPTATTLDPKDSYGQDTALSNGNLTATTTAGAYSGVRATQSRNSGKLAFEITCNTAGPYGAGLVIGPATGWYTNAVGNIFDTLGVGSYAGLAFNAFSGIAGNPNLGTAGNTIMWLIDFSEYDDIWVTDGTTINGTNSFFSGANPTAGTGGLLAYFRAQGQPAGRMLKDAGGLWPAVSVYSGFECTFNFGATGFVNPLPSGFSAWT